MKKYITILVLVLVGLNTKSQVIDNKINIYYGFGMNTLIGGNNLLNEDGFITPSLYSNMQSFNSNNYKIVLNKGMFSYGFAIKVNNFKSWKLENYSNYSNSKIKMRAYSPVIQIHNKFKNTGIFNRLKIYVELKPVFARTSLNLNNPIYDIHFNSDTIKTLQIHETVLGGELTAGFEYSINKVVGIYANYGLSYYSLNSVYYNDKSLKFTSIEFGLYFRLYKNKHFYYN